MREVIERSGRRSYLRVNKVRILKQNLCVDSDVRSNGTVSYTKLEVTDAKSGCSSEGEEKDPARV
jgi:hypothetical protein